MSFCLLVSSFSAAVAAVFRLLVFVKLVIDLLFHCERKIVVTLDAI
jgi:hypothetical protein